MKANPYDVPVVDETPRRTIPWHLIPAVITLVIGVPWTALMGWNLIRGVRQAAEALHFPPDSPRQVLWFPALVFLGMGFSVGLVFLAASYSFCRQRWVVGALLTLFAIVVFVGFFLFAPRF
jgi:hypothetical protein